MTRIIGAYVCTLEQFHETEHGFSTEASNLQFPVGKWPKMLLIDGRYFKLSSFDDEAMIYRCEDGEKPEKVEVFND